MSEDLSDADNATVISRRSVVDSGRLLSIRSMMTFRQRQSPKRPGMKPKRGTYTLVMRGPDGCLHCELFDDAASYLARVMALQAWSAESVSIEDVLGLLDA
jgi:hypothetical protein